MAERPTGALHDTDYDERPAVDDSVDTAETPDVDAEAPSGWHATHFAAGGGEAEDEAGNSVIFGPDGSVSTFLAEDVDVTSDQ